jgi:hypothetical protein
MRFSTILACALLALAPTVAGSEPAAGRFPDYGFLPDPGVYHPARLFKLSQTYPAALQPPSGAIKKILAIDFQKDWKAYSHAAFDYVMDGNVHGGGVDNDFFLEDNRVRHWYHVPWLHVGDNGREALHGLTAEGPEAQFSLGPLQTSPRPWQTYAVGFYNAPGGYAIGRFWADAHHPDGSAVRRMGGFPVGTVVGKLLFSTAPVSEAPFLGNGIAWNAYIRPTECMHIPGNPSPPLPARCNDKQGKPLKIMPREVDTVRLIQMDIMVRDARADATGGWVFLTYVYNGLVAAPDRWRNLVPLGILWGNDPAVHSHEDGNKAPRATEINPDLKHTVIAWNDPKVPAAHLGFGLRLSGPADNTLSSCKSCHQTAEHPTNSPILPFLLEGPDGKILNPPLSPSDPRWRLWFRDIGPITPFDPGSVSTDNSLQLAESIDNFNAAKTKPTVGLMAVRAAKPVYQIDGERGETPELAEEEARQNADSARPKP